MAQLNETTMTKLVAVPKDQLKTLKSLTMEIDAVAGCGELLELRNQLQILIDSRQLHLNVTQTMTEYMAVSKADLIDWQNDIQEYFSHGDGSGRATNVAACLSEIEKYIEKSPLVMP